MAWLWSIITQGMSWTRLTVSFPSSLTQLVPLRCILRQNSRRRPLKMAQQHVNRVPWSMFNKLSGMLRHSSGMIQTGAIHCSRGLTTCSHVITSQWECFATAGAIFGEILYAANRHPEMDVWAQVDWHLHKGLHAVFVLHDVVWGTLGDSTTFVLLPEVKE